MQITYQDDQVVVIDEFLEQRAFATLSGYVCGLSFPGRIYASAIKKRPPRAAMQNFIYLSEAAKSRFPQLAAEAARRRFIQPLPSGDPPDLLSDRLADVDETIRAVFGAPDRDWYGYSRNCFRYNAGTGFVWHVDDDYVGSYIYYASPKWSPNWGGELMLHSGQVPDWRKLAPAEGLARFDRGRFVFPAPNRFILIRGDTPHRVNAVSPTAEYPRLTIGGFFMSERGLQRLQDNFARQFTSQPAWKRAAMQVALKFGKWAYR